MEDFSYVNFFKLISLQKARIPLVETGVVQNDFIETLVCSDEFGYVKKKNPNKAVPVLGYLQKIMEENELRNRLHCEKNDKVCYFYKKGVKKTCDESKVKEILLHPRLNLNIDMLQKYVPTFNDSDKPFILKLSYVKNEYKADCSYNKSHIKDPIALNQMLDIATIVMHLMEQILLKRIIQLNIEYTKDRGGLLWISSVPKCLLIEAKLTISHPIHTESDIEALSKTIPKSSIKTPVTAQVRKRENKYYEVKRPLKQVEEENYVFKRGQLRNNRSNLDSPIRIMSVEPEASGTPTTSQSPSDDGDNKSDCWGGFYQNSNQDGFLGIKGKSFEGNMIGEVFKNFVKFRNKPPRKSILERRNTMKIPADAKKAQKPKRKTHFAYPNKSLPKLVKLPKQSVYAKNFIELVMKTYCKNVKKTDKKLSSHLPEEFGMGTSLTSEEFSKFLSTVDVIKEDYSKNRYSSKQNIEELGNSKSTTPIEEYKIKKIDTQNVKNILEKRKKILGKPYAQTSRRKSKSMLSLLISTPRAKVRSSKRKSIIDLIS